MSRKDAWPQEQIDALFAVFDSIGPKELNVLMRPGARFGNFMEQACMGVFGEVEPKLLTRVRSRVSRIKRDFLDYLILLRDKERDPSVADEEYSRKLALLYQRLPKSLIGLHVTFDVKEDVSDYEEADEKRGKVKSKKDTPPAAAVSSVTKPKPLFRVPVDKSKKGDKRTSPEEEPAPVTGKYKLDGYGGGATVEKVGGSNVVKDAIVDESIHIGEDDILSGPRNQISAQEALKREQAEALKAFKEREERLRLRREGSEGRTSLFGGSDVEVSEENSDKKSNSDKKADSDKKQKTTEKTSSSQKSSTADKETLEKALVKEGEGGAENEKFFKAIYSRKANREARQEALKLMHSGDSDEEMFPLGHGEMSSLPTSTPKRLKRHHNSTQEHSSPTKRNSSLSQRLSVGLDDDESDNDFLLNTSEPKRATSRGQSLQKLPAPIQPTTTAQEPPKRKRGRPRKDAVPATAIFGAAAPTNASTAASTAPPKTRVSMSNANSSNFHVNSNANSDAMSSNHLPQYLDGMQQFLSSVERLYVLADGDATMRKALAQLVVATTEKIERSTMG